MGLRSLLSWCARCSREKTKDSKRNFVKVDSPWKIGASSVRSPSLRFNDTSEVSRGFSHQRAMTRSEIMGSSHFAFMCSAKEQGQRQKVLKLLIKLQWNYLLAPGLHWCNPTWKLLSDISLDFSCSLVGVHSFQVQTCHSYWWGCNMLLKPSLLPVLLKQKTGTKARKKQHYCNGSQCGYRKVCCKLRVGDKHTASTDIFFESYAWEVSCHWKTMGHKKKVPIRWTSLRTK